MPMSAPVLSAAIRVAMLANPATQAQDNAALTAMCDAIATAVVAHIQSTAVVVGTANPGGLVVAGTVT